MFQWIATKGRSESFLVWKNLSNPNWALPIEKPRTASDFYFICLFTQFIPLLSVPKRSPGWLFDEGSPHFTDILPHFIAYDHVELIYDASLGEEYQAHKANDY